MPRPEEHAVVTASAYERWSHCTAAPRFEEQFPPGTSSYAEEGTLAHAVCELHGRKHFTPMSKRAFTSALKKLQADPVWSDEMLQTAEIYVSYLSEKAHEYSDTPQVDFEVRVDLSDYIPEGFGTCDCVMIGDDTLRITDYKHGKGVPVSSINNGQMRLYALGALKRWAPIFGDTITKICTAIVQPRITEDVTEEWITVDELLAWGEAIKPIAQAAFVGTGDFAPGEWCQFCRGKAECRARAEHFGELFEYVEAVPVGRAMEDASPVRVLTDAEVADLLTRGEGLAAWYADLQNYARQRILEGGVIPGWKVVEGRQERAFIDNGVALDHLKAAGLTEADFFTTKPKSPAQVEKALGKKRFEELLGELITYLPGSPTLVTESDKRKNYTPAPGAGEFAGVKADE